LYVETIADQDTKDSPITCFIFVPIRYDLDIDIRGKAWLSIEDMQSDDIHVKASYGMCLLKKIQSNTIHVSTAGSAIVCKGSLHGNVKLSTERTGDISVAKVLGLTLEATTVKGDVEIDNLYVDNSSFITNDGNISIKKCHRQCEVSCSGKGGMRIESLDGDLDADLVSGEAYVEVSKDSQVNISSEKGNVTVVYPNVPIVSEVELQYRTLKIDEELLVLEEEYCKDNVVKGRLEVLADKENELDFGRYNENTWNSSELLTHKPSSNVCIRAPSGKVHLYCRHDSKGAIFNMLPEYLRDPVQYEKTLKKKKKEEDKADPLKSLAEIVKR